MAASGKRCRPAPSVAVAREVALGLQAGTDLGKELTHHRRWQYIKPFGDGLENAAVPPPTTLSTQNFLELAMDGTRRHTGLSRIATMTGGVKSR